MIFSRGKTPVLISFVYSRGKAVSIPVIPKGLSFSPRDFSLCGVGGVIGGDHIDCIVFNTEQKGVFIFGGAKRRIHFKAPLLTQILVAEDKIMRCGFAGNIDSAFLCISYEGNTLFVEMMQT